MNEQSGLEYSCTISEMNGVEVVEGSDDEGTTMEHTTYNCLCTPGMGNDDGDGDGDGDDSDGSLIIFPGQARKPVPLPVPPESDYFSCAKIALETYNRELADCRSNFQVIDSDGATSAIPSADLSDTNRISSKRGYYQCETDMQKILQEDLRRCNNRYLKKVDGWKERWNPK